MKKRNNRLKNSDGGKPPPSKADGTPSEHSQSRSNPTKKACVIYARCAVRSATNICVQIQTCRTFADRQGLQESAIYVDDGFGGSSSRNRLGLQHLLQSAQRGRFDVVLVKDIHRLARTPAHLEMIITQLKALGVMTISAEDGTALDADTAVARLQALEAARGAPRTRRQAYEARLRADLVRRIFAQCLHGMSTSEIAAELSRVDTSET